MQPLVAGITSSVTSAIADHAVVVVFVLMAVDALLPVGGELVMLYAGVVASGSVAGHTAGFAGTTLPAGLESYLVLAAAGSLGYLAGSVAGWAIGKRGGRPLIERHGRWFHLSSERFARAEAWFARWGRLAVFLGRLTPLVRSFISIPAGVFRSPLGPYVALTLAGSVIWCFGFAAAGWALGGSWHSVHDAFRYLDYAVVAIALLLIALIGVRTAQRVRRV
jgi:membrane protein DedA with SNARE-associated domain